MAVTRLEKEIAMLDLFYALVTIAFFAAAVAYTYACEKL